MFMNRSVDTHQFAMVPKKDIPRSSFDCQKTLKTTFDAGYLVPIYVDEMLPGDTYRLNMTAFTRLSTPIVPVMDNLHLDTFFFFVPNRLLWTHWVNFMGEQDSPGDSISFTIPQQVCPAGGYAINSLQDYMGLPTVGQVGVGNTVSHSALWLRAYNLIWNKWFRDENLQNSVTVDLGDGPDTVANYTLLRRGKRFDYFTGCLPWPQKGATAVSLPLGSTAPIKSDNTDIQIKGASTGANQNIKMGQISSSNALGYSGSILSSENARFGTNTGLYADLSAATAATINAIRLAFQTQKLLETDARGGTRYTEIVRSHFGVVSPDARLQRPEYLGGGSTPVTISPVPQTSGTSASGTTTPMGTLSAIGTSLARGHGFTYSSTEHGVLLGLCSVRADLTYQQGLDRVW